jgi:hypothetical protein
MEKRRTAYNNNEHGLNPYTFARCSTLAVLGVAIPDGENKFKIVARFIGVDYDDIISYWSKKIGRDVVLCVAAVLGTIFGAYTIYDSMRPRRRGYL